MGVQHLLHYENSHPSGIYAGLETVLMEIYHDNVNAVKNRNYVDVHDKFGPGDREARCLMLNVEEVWDAIDIGYFGNMEFLNIVGQEAVMESTKLGATKFLREELITASDDPDDLANSAQDSLVSWGLNVDIMEEFVPRFYAHKRLAIVASPDGFDANVKWRMGYVPLEEIPLVTPQAKLFSNEELMSAAFTKDSEGNYSLVGIDEWIEGNDWFSDGMDSPYRFENLDVNPESADSSYQCLITHPQKEQEVHNAIWVRSFLNAFCRVKGFPTISVS